MENLFKYNSDRKFCLVAKINGLSGEVKRIRRFDLKEKSVRLMSTLMARKNFIGNDVRHHLLAYAFMRGVSYKSIEKSYRNDNKPRANIISRIVNYHYVSYFATSQDHYSSEQIDKWLKSEEV